MEIGNKLVWQLIELIIPITICLVIVIGIIGLFSFSATRKNIYECRNCKTRREFSKKEVMFSIRSMSDRLFYCPVCKKRCWHRRIL